MWSEAKCDARWLAQNIDKDRTLLIVFQVYKSENNKVKWNKSRLSWLIWLRVRGVRHDCDMILAKPDFHRHRHWNLNWVEGA